MPCIITDDEKIKNELLLALKHAKHHLPWFYLGVAYASDKTSSVSYQIFPTRYEGTHIQFGCDDRNFDRFIPNDDGQTLREYLAKIVSGKIKNYESIPDKNPLAQGAQWYRYRFYELQSDGSYASEESSFEFYSISVSEAYALMEVERMDQEVPKAPELDTQKKVAKRV